MLVKRLFAFKGTLSNASIQHRLKYLITAALVALAFYLAILNRQWAHLDKVFRFEPSHNPPLPPVPTSNHPIYKLAENAQVQFKQLLGKRSVSLEQAASRYRERRGRHPPPGFDKWFSAAQKSDAIIVEDFFDRIYHDINPFWALEPARLRRMIKDEQHYIRVRDGKAWFISDHLELRQPWVQRWTELVQEMMPNLPDLDMVLNVMDETRVLVPWEDITKYATEERRQRNIFHPSEAVAEYTKYQDEHSDKDEPAIKVEWIGNELHKYWDHYRVTCPPDTPGHNASSLETLERPPSYPTQPLPFTKDGFIQNFTASTDPCLQPHIRGMHGTFIESVSMSTTHSLFPIFGGSVGILTAGTGRRKKNELVWRGVASGGRHKAENWWGFQRLRFIQMMNGTTVSLLEAGEDVAPTFRLSELGEYQTEAQRNNSLGKWISSISDAAFVRFECFPQQEDKLCSYLAPYMELRDSIHMKEQYNYKFLPDIDGNSYSGRFRAFMRSTSLVLKSTIYAEWHDDRLTPWVHFVPFDNSFIDIYAILEYYLAHDAEAHRIAEEGREWSEKVMRREDMKLYVWRLLLEYARVMDPAREKLAFVEDLKG
ncbi:hypothetical protein GQX73_g1621 [Xylaria multiplex]|uniref:Glycosyl transferase CAP10 domain-containing protein n=1 Tax=Xylaria multiplex TaxID=323545 RepID=A0A7C8J6R3_9PEZI|nr:hypothetical protein GQX73_g1621 [Xylaria multiplex]